MVGSVLFVVGAFTIAAVNYMKHRAFGTMPAMKAYFIQSGSNATTLELRDVPRPEPKAGQVLVRVRAASLNRGEFLAGHGLTKPGAAKPAGTDGAGEVEGTGERVMGRLPGAFAEYALMDQYDLIPVPGHLSWEEAAAVPITFMVVHDMLLEQGNLKAGEWLLVTAVTSGVGVAALQAGADAETRPPSEVEAQIVGRADDGESLECLVVEIDGTAFSDGSDLLQLTAYEVASRLSYTFWQTMPDAELLDAWNRDRDSDAISVLAAFDSILRSELTEVLVAVGDAEKIRRTLQVGSSIATPSRAAVVSSAAEANVRAPASQGPNAAAPPVESQDTLQNLAELFVKERLAVVVKTTTSSLDSHSTFEQCGMDSVMMMELRDSLSKDLGALPKTVLFEHDTPARLARYLLVNCQDALRAHIGDAVRATPVSKNHASPEIPSPSRLTPNRQQQPVRALTQPAVRASLNRSAPVASSASPYPEEGVAIIGVAGQFPNAANLSEFWSNVQSARECITDIPSERWDARQGDAGCGQGRHRVQHMRRRGRQCQPHELGLCTLEPLAQARDLLLQRGDALADGRLRQVHTFGGARKRAGFGDGANQNSDAAATVVARSSTGMAR